MLYSTYIYGERDCVRAVTLRVGGREFHAHNALQFFQELLKLAKFWRSKLELAERATTTMDDDRFQAYILTEKGDWVPVDHFLWKEADGRQVRLDFTEGRNYLHDGNRPLQSLRSTYRAFRLMASAIRRFALTKSTY